MPRRAALLAMTVLVCAVAAPPAALAAPGKWIVVLEPTAGDPGAVATEHGARFDAQAQHVFRSAVHGYAGTIPAAQVEGVRRDPRVRYVEPDLPMTAAAQALPWGIDRVDADLASTRAGNGSGAVSNVNAYVIDTGIDAAHPDLNVVRHVNFAGGQNTDCNGHGTHVAGTVAARDNTSSVVGVAPGAPLTGVKVLSCSGSGTTSGVIAGVDWVTANARRPAIANMSLGGGVSQALDDAVRRSAASGVVYTLAAGNDGADACASSPARSGTANGIVTIAATDTAERETSWSNHGACVDLWAPGASILSTRRGGGTTTMSGTSMAAPHAGGGAALYLSRNTGANPAGVEAALKAAATATGTRSRDGRAIARLNVRGF